MKELSREEKISKIYEVIADKSHTSGCIVIGYPGKGKHGPIKGIESDCDAGEGYGFWCRRNKEADEIIGHPVMIGDVLDWVKSVLDEDSQEEYLIFTGEEILLVNLYQKRGNTRKPIDDQSDECIDFVYSLIKDPCQN